MSKNKTVLAVILLLALIPLTANATITRVIGLGGEGANYIVKDAYNPNIWPQLLRVYPNLAGGEFYTSINGWDFQKAYINYDFGEDKCVMQIALDKEPGAKYEMAPNDLDLLAAGPYNRLSVAVGRPLGDLLVGVGINYTGKSYKSDAYGAVPTYDISYATYGIRLGASALEKKLDLALGVEMASFSEDEGGTTTIDNDGSMSMGFAGRYWYTANDHYALIPNAKFSMMKDAAKYPAAATESNESETTTIFAIGIGNNWTPVENMLAIFELGVMSTSEKYESKSGGTSLSNTDSEMDIYWRLGFESKIFGWLDGRLGAERNWQSMTIESMPGKPDIGTNMTATYLGATAHWNRLNLDLLIAPAFMQHGPYFLSGVGGQTFERVSLKYDFNQ